MTFSDTLLRHELAHALGVIAMNCGPCTIAPLGDEHLTVLYDQESASPIDRAVVLLAGLVIEDGLDLSDDRKALKEFDGEVIYQAAAIVRDVVIPKLVAVTDDSDTPGSRTTVLTHGSATLTSVCNAPCWSV